MADRSLAKSEQSWAQHHPSPHLLPSVSSFSNHQSKGTRLTYCVWGGEAAGSESVGREQRRACQA